MHGRLPLVDGSLKKEGASSVVMDDKRGLGELPRPGPVRTLTKLSPGSADAPSLD